MTLVSPQLRQFANGESHSAEMPNFTTLVGRVLTGLCPSIAAPEVR